MAAKIIKKSERNPILSQFIAKICFSPLIIGLFCVNLHPNTHYYRQMAESNFVDYVKIYCRSGKGGRGSMHLRHVKYQPNGGPDGGDGGHGGSVILRGNHNYWT